jgi:hypothetical protein
MDNLTPFLQTLSILSATYAASTNLTTSIITYPALRKATNQQTLLTQWHTLFNSGIVPVVTTSATAGLGFAMLAYLAPIGAVSVWSEKRNFYAAASVVMLSLAPYTRIVLGSTIDELSRRAEAGKEEKDSKELFERWGVLNFWRGCFLMVGAGMGVWASVCV